MPRARQRRRVYNGTLRAGVGVVSRTCQGFRWLGKEEVWLFHRWGEVRLEVASDGLHAMLYSFNGMEKFGVRGEAQGFRRSMGLREKQVQGGCPIRRRDVTGGRAEKKLPCGAASGWLVARG